MATVAVHGGTIAWFVARGRIARHSARFVRVNFEGREVPAVLGDALCAGAVSGLAALAVVDAVAAWVDAGRMIAAVALVTVVLWAAGRWDDLQGDEQSRGFSGHLSAARSGRITGGLVKLIAGGVVGLVAGAIVAEGRAIVEIGLVIALFANLLNLLDRAPGRAGKVALLTGVPMALLGSSSWAFAAIAPGGALVACLWFDLRATGMLGDAGANPLGGVAGLGLAAALDEPGRVAAIAVLLVLNLASERYSFSRAIERVGVLRALDRLGRRPSLPK
jgi:hypothetical protein